LTNCKQLIEKKLVTEQVKTIVDEEERQLITDEQRRKTVGNAKKAASCAIQINVNGHFYKLVIAQNLS